MPFDPDDPGPYREPLEPRDEPRGGGGFRGVSTPFPAGGALAAGFLGFPSSGGAGFDFSPFRRRLMARLGHLAALRPRTQLAGGPGGFAGGGAAPEGLGGGGPAAYGGATAGGAAPEGFGGRQGAMRAAARFTPGGQSAPSGEPGTDWQGSYNRLFQQLIGSGIGAGAFSPYGSQGLLDVLTQRGVAENQARQRQAVLSAELASPDDPLMRGYAGLQARLGGQSDLARLLGDARLQSILQNQGFLQALLGGPAAGRTFTRDPREGGGIGHLGLGFGGGGG